jgi:glutathione S-transferase
VKVYGDIRSGNYYKISLAHEGGFDLTAYPAIQGWLKRIADQPNYVGMA